MKRFAAKIAQGIARLARWRKPSASIMESIDTAVTDDASEKLQQPQHDETERLVEQDATPEPKEPLLARLKNLFHRPQQSDQVVADEVDSAIRKEKPSAARVSSDEVSVDDEDAPPAGLVQRLSSKWMVISGGGVMLIALVATLAGMLLQSGQEKKQLQIELVAAQQKLKQAGAAQKPASIKSTPLKSAIHPTVAIAANPPAPPRAAAMGGECELSNPENAAENLKRCIDSFNAMSE